jgi:hypothetical protein
MAAPTRRLVTTMLAMVVAASVFSGCGADDDAASSGASDGADAAAETTTSEGSADTSTTEGTTTEAPEVTEAETTTTLSDEGRDTETSELDSLPDGTHHGYMAGLESGTVEGQPVQVIIFDPVEFLTGDAAVAAAQEDGVIPEDQDFIENDYYVRNQDQTVRRLAVVPDAQVSTLSGGGPDLVASSVDEVWNQSYLFRIEVGNVREITTVSGIEAVYLP